MRSLIVSGCRLNEGLLARLLQDIPEDKWTHQPAPGIKNHPMWQLGHRAVALDGGAQLLGHKSQLPDGWGELFGMGSQPVDDPSKYPPRDVLLKAINDARERVIDAFEKATDAQLSAEPPVEWMKPVFGTVGNAVGGVMTSHEAFHNGQLSTWRRMIGLGSIM